MSEIEDYINSLTEEDLERIEKEVSDWDDLDMDIFIPDTVGESDKLKNLEGGKG